MFWLVEELLDSQTIDGCRIVFDYLDSRRDLLTAKHFKQKNLIILRSCNELLRRLSRAEDTVFCGRVFIFLFQSFPLGDKSSVNLRGEYHVENVTTFEKLQQISPREDVNGMDVDGEGGHNAQQAASAPSESKDVQETSKESSTKHEEPPKITTSEEGQAKIDEEEDLGMDKLYSIFWSLQESFSQPTKLFNATDLSSFKTGLQATIRKFKDIQQERQARGPTRPSEEGNRGVKRKRGGREDDLSSAFNPKYLTSRDLFDLEISDLAFRRHILVQSLILIDFLLSLTPKAKRKLEHMSNRSVLYTYTLEDDDANWASNMRNEIASYLQQGPEGKFYYRMVDTVLSRDKNWTHWKAEACPPISKAPISGEDFDGAMTGAQRACANKKLRSTPLGTLDLGFLNSTGGTDGLEKLKQPERYSIPTADSFERPIADDEFEIEMAQTEEERRVAEDAKSSKIWRTLRIACKDQLNVFDKIDDGKHLRVLFHPDGKTEDPTQGSGDDDKENMEAAPDRADEGAEGESGGEDALADLGVTKTDDALASGHEIPKAVPAADLKPVEESVVK